MKLEPKMSYVELYTLTRNQLPANVGDYVKLIRFPSIPSTKIVPISGTDYTDNRMAEITETSVACKVYRLGETGKPDRLVAIDPDIVDNIKFVALDKVKAQLAAEKLRVEDIAKKLAYSEYMLKQAHQKSDDLVTECHRLEYETPIWKILCSRFLNWYYN